jgi:RimJ/RimL family protein N-acetyltransferase
MYGSSLSRGKERRVDFAEGTITTGRLDLVPLQAEDADEMAAVLGDERLHEFIGGRPATLAELRERYAKLAAGSSNPAEVWLNWIVRRRSDAQAVGTVQATLTSHDGRWTAHIAWVIGVDWQNQGFASEAARALVDWLRRRGAQSVAAHIHPDHRASAAVAARAGLEQTRDEVEGEQVWRAPKAD